MKVVLLTGASRGIGASIVKVLLSNSAIRLVAVARSANALTELQSTYGADKLQFVAGDITDSDVLQKAVDLAISKFGQLNSLILNAGMLDPVDPVSKANVKEWQNLFNVNFFSVVELTKISLPHLIKTNGSVIMVSSGASTKPYNGWGAYGASKAALNHYCQSLAAENSQISAISVAPGVVDTQMQTDIREKFGANMTADSLKRFTDLKENGELLDPIVPATIYANLATKGIPEQLNGEYLRYNDPKLESFGQS